MAMKSRFQQTVIGALALLIFSCFGAKAADLGAPSGDVVLTVTGAIANTNGDGAAGFDMAMLESMAATEFETTTIWTDGTHRFKGVSLDVVLDAVGASGAMLKAAAINDYAVEVPVSDAKPGGPIIAYAMDGKEMSVRDKGPLWIVYPYDTNRIYRSEVIYSRSIWQLASIEVME